MTGITNHCGDMTYGMDPPLKKTHMGISQGLRLCPVMQGAQVQFLVVELRSYMPCSKKNK